jgi:hypothetical protein
MTVSLVWESDSAGSRPKVCRAAYASLEDALRQALGDDRPGRRDPCPTCGHHVTGGPSGLGDIARGVHVLRIEDENGETLWKPDS